MWSKKGEKDAPSLALGAVQRLRGQAFMRNETDKLGQIIFLDILISF